ncbi:hypothetical protein BKH46_08010 [Helicobacter sp. 12S02634-8]|uniref:hypothetical protein n=1 Tax=Helicobacter sp. 12S02634-8 TaxID=1476199 RepID=UPI000BA748DE|nr:hypothetical protein [Helicobacter sp. 12S02634-8]PAF46321.1 hypothetical protein BKH46_08010 [Helicobacter sp. 12S02634-8]
MNRIVVILILGFNTLFSLDKCEIGYKVLYTIAQVERHPKREVGYPYIISFNRTQDIAKLSDLVSEGQYEKLDNRSIDCKNQKNCVLIYSKISQNQIPNVDLGAFQINPKYHQASPEDYFSLQKSIAIACGILTEIKQKYGWSWESLAKYHSYEKKNNLKYQKHLKRYAGEYQGTR